MKILFTGGSSFSGFWFTRTLAAAGHTLVCPLRRRAEDYSGLRRERVERLKGFAQLAPEAAFGSEKFIRLLKEGGPWDALCHHAAQVENYKSPDFDACQALENNTHRLRAVLEAFKSSGGKAVVLTGTTFEPDEGDGEPPLRAFSPYGLAKGLAWQVFRFYSGEVALPLGKFVMPNPFGPWEEPRFTAYLMNAWRARNPAQVKTPDYVRDNIHVDLLALVYRNFAEGVAGTKGPRLLKTNPSGYAEAQGAFAKRVAGEVRRRTGWPCELELMKQTDFSEPLKRVNLEPAAPGAPSWDERKAWDAFVEFYAAKRE